jgi:hypothetical protein
MGGNFAGDIIDAHALLEAVAAIKRGLEPQIAFIHFKERQSAGSADGDPAATVRGLGSNILGEVAADSFNAAPGTSRHHVLLSMELSSQSNFFDEKETGRS